MLFYEVDHLIVKLSQVRTSKNLVNIKTTTEVRTNLVKTITMVEVASQRFNTRYDVRVTVEGVCHHSHRAPAQQHVE